MHTHDQGVDKVLANLTPGGRCWFSFPLVCSRCDNTESEILYTLRVWLLHSVFLSLASVLSVLSVSVSVSLSVSVCLSLSLFLSLSVAGSKELELLLTLASCTQRAEREGGAERERAGARERVEVLNPGINQCTH